MGYAQHKHVIIMGWHVVTPFIPKVGKGAHTWYSQGTPTWYSYDEEITNRFDFFTIHQKYRNRALKSPNNKIANPRQHAQRRIIIATLQLKLKHHYHNKPSDRLTYNLTSARQSEEIPPTTDLENIENWTVGTPNGNIELYWANLKGVTKTLGYKYPKSENDKIYDGATLGILRNIRTKLNYDKFKIVKELNNTLNIKAIGKYFRIWPNDKRTVSGQ